MRARRLILWMSLWSSCVAAQPACPRIDVEAIAVRKPMERLVAAYTLTTPEAGTKWVVLVGSDATVNADGAPDSYEVSDHGTSYLCDGMCVLVDGHCRSRKSCRSVSARLKELPSRPEGLLVTCDPPFDIFRRVRFFGFRASPKTDDGYTECGKTILPIAGREVDDGLRYLIPATSMTLRDGKALPSQEIPFIVRPGNWKTAAPDALHFDIADFAWVVAPYADGDVQSAALVGDTGPDGKFGEGSIALHQRLTLDDLAPAPTYVDSPNRRHPDLKKIPLPYYDACDGDVRAKVSASGPWWYLISPGTGNQASTELAESRELLETMKSRLEERSKPFGGLTCLRRRLHEAGVVTIDHGRPSADQRFGRTAGRCPR